MFKNANPGQFGGAVQEASPLLLAMSQGLLSGQGIGSALPQGLALMDQKRKQREQEGERKRASEAFNRLVGGGGPIVAASRRPTATPFVPKDGSDMSARLGVNLSEFEQKYNLPAGYLARTAQIESGGDPNAQNPNSSAGGPFQFIDSTAKQYGLTDRFNVRDATDAASRLARDNAQFLRQRLGREPSAAELYLAHQQGAGGAAKLLANPNARAADIVGQDAVRLNGGDANMTAGQFANKWLGKFGGQQSAPQQQQVAQAGPQYDPGAIMQLMANPNIGPGQRAVLQMLYQQQMQNSDPMRQLQIQQMQQQMNAGPSPTDDMREYVFAQEQGFPGTFSDWMQSNRKAGATNVNVNNGPSMPGLSKLGEGYTYLYDQKGNVMLDEQGMPMSAAVPGGPADRDIKQAEAEKQTAIDKRGETARTQEIKRGVTLENIFLNQSEIRDGGFPVTGALGVVGSYVPGTPGYDFAVRNAQISAASAFSELQNMRDNSPTGGAVGSLTDKEREAISASISNLQQASSQEEYLRASSRLESLMLDTAYGQGNWSKLDDGSIAVKASDTENGLPEVGVMQDGYRFLGGDPSQRKNWEKVSK